MFVAVRLVLLRCVGAIVVITVAVTPVAAQDEPSATGLDALPTQVELWSDAPVWLYARVKTRAATREGRIRLRGGESFGDDVLDATRAERPQLEAVPEEMRSRKAKTEVFGLELELPWASNESVRRTLSVRLRDVARIEQRFRGELWVVLLDGTEIECDGSFDLARNLVLLDPQRGSLSIPWNEIENVELIDGPPDAAQSTADPWVGVRTGLYGRVETAAGTFRGRLRWDRDETMSTEELNGRTDDGELAVPFHRIRRVERLANSSLVTFRDGGTLDLGGTNDVDRSQRGMVVDVPDLGQVVVPWELVRTVDFEQGPAEGVAAGGPRASGPIRGTVRSAAGTELRGRIVFDADESHVAELLDGAKDGVRYRIRFADIASLVVLGEGTEVTLRGGRVLSLEASDADPDLGDEGAGVVVVPDRGSPVHLRWSEIGEIRLDEPPLSSSGRP